LALGLLGILIYVTLRFEFSFALGAIDYLWRGTGHVRGGIGVLAQGLVGAIRAQGGQVSLADRVLHLRREADGGWLVTTRKGEQRARRVISTLHPRAMAALLPEEARPASLERLSARLDEGWGAVMLYRGLVDHPDLPEGARHVELVGDPAAPFVEGNHVFCSLSARDEAGRAPEGQRTLTVSTHIAAAALRGVPPAEQAAREVLANRASPRAYDGQMLLAQALSGQRQYPQAAIAYDDAHQTLKAMT
jgi:phytoene dehydrogenase-like protein